MKFQDLETVSQGSVIRLRLSGGLLSVREARELTYAAEATAEDESVRVVILEASGDDFCVGPASDLSVTTLDIDPAAALAGIRPPVVAAIAGRAHSVGLELILAADLRIVADDATFALPDLLMGRLPCWGGTQRLPRVVGRSNAASMLLLSEEMDATTALHSGLAHEVVARGSLTDRVDAVVEQLLQLGPLALQYAKEAVRVGSELPMREGLRLEGDLNSLLQASEDRREGLAAFSEKRAPRFVGR